jgi:ribosomal-protein-alanine N-acetyltransferase
MDRISLRPLLKSDGPALLEANRESRDYHGAYGSSLNEATWDQWYGQLLAGPYVSLLAIDPESHGLVGLINFNEIVAGPAQTAFISYYGMVRFARRGLMTQAVGLAVRYAFDALGLHRVEAIIQRENTRSIALVKRLGFRCEGISVRYLNVNGAWRDVERWAILDDEYIALPVNA